MAQYKARQLEPSDLHGLHMGMPVSLFYSAHLGPQLSPIGNKVWPLFEQQMGLWPLHPVLKIIFGAR